MRFKHYKLTFRIYIVFLILAAVLPINSSDSNSINNIFIIQIRLDYFIHAMLFLPWVLLCQLAFNRALAINYWLIAGAGLLMATFTEGIQYFLTYRSYNINDLLANYLGVGLGTLLAVIGMAIYRRRLKSEE
jgi:VanZ family protein